MAPSAATQPAAGRLMPMEAKSTPARASAAPALPQPWSQPLSPAALIKVLQQTLSFTDAKSPALPVQTCLSHNTYVSQGFCFACPSSVLVEDTLPSGTSYVRACSAVEMITLGPCRAPASLLEHNMSVCICACQMHAND